MLIVVGILLVISVFMIKANEDKIIKDYIEVQGSCYLSDGTCLHDDRNMTGYIIGWILGATIVMLGLYLLLFDKTQEMMEKSQKAMEENQKDFIEKVSEDKKSKEFEAFLSAFNNKRKKIIRTIKDNERITQSTLRFKTGLSKAQLSILINDLEKNNFISRKAKGKTYEVYLKEYR